MGMWPFRRKSNRKQSRGGADLPSSEGDVMHEPGTKRDPGRHNGPEITSTNVERRRSRKDKNRKSSRESKKLQRNPERRRTYSFSPGRNDDIQVDRDVSRPPVPPLPANLKAKGLGGDKDATVGQKLFRASTQPADETQEWSRMPTLHKRSAADLARRKSSKKRKEDHDREAEIKAMVPLMPTRPATDNILAGRPMKKDSKKMRAGLNRNLQNPSSDISLPTAESITSSLSVLSEHRASYKVSALEMLAPRPTLRYAENPRYVPGASGYGSDRSDSRRRRVSDRAPIPEETLKASKRVDELANDLDAGELRELMERDQKRKEKKKLADKQKIEKKLARRQEKQKTEEETAIRNGTPPPTNMERGVLGRDVVGLGIGNSAVVTSSKRKGSDASNKGGGKRPTEVFREDSTTAAGDLHKTISNTSGQFYTPMSERSDPVIETAQLAAVVDRSNISPPSSPKESEEQGSSISQMMDLTRLPTVAPTEPVPAKQTSGRGPQSWTSFFRRGSRSKRGSTPSSFSNTSRDSFQSGQGPQIGYPAVRRTSNVPKRTMSKFREDLPELPISPPDSRIQSPEVDVVPPITKDYLDKKAGLRVSSEGSGLRYDTPTSGYRSLEAARLRDETPTSGHRSSEAPSPEPAAVLSQSLASIDSEGSWLSGRRGGSKRGSAQLPPHPLRDSASSLQKRYKDYAGSTEELGIAEDEYFSRLSPSPEEERRMRRQSAGNPVASSDDDEGGSLPSPISSSVPSELTKWGAVARQPTVVHREPRAKSREGLLNYFEDDSISDIQSITTKDSKRRSYPMNRDMNDGDSASVHRATSIDLGKGKGHARHISAGSARLLELKPRASGESKRMSVA